MKPTKEQLADPKWWERHVFEHHDYAYWDDGNGIATFSISPINEAGLELLAKRPEPEWVPEVGDVCEGMRAKVNKYMKCKVLAYEDRMYVVMFLDMNELQWCNDLRPIKTQREELIDMVTLNLNMGAESSGVADAILARFDLTKKESE